MPTLEEEACTPTPHQNYAALCKGLSSAPTATYQEWLNSSCDVYHGLAFEEPVSCPLPFAASLHFSLFCWVLHSVQGPLYFT